MNAFLLWLGGALLNWALDTIFSPIKDYFTKLFTHKKLSDAAKKIAISFDSYSSQYLRQPQYTIPIIGHIEREEVLAIKNAWANGVNGVILTGEAGAGKSGLALDLAKYLRSHKIPVLFIRATDYESIADPATALQQLLRIDAGLGESFATLGMEKECVLIVDQLDSVSESISLLGFVNLLKSVAEIEGVRALAVSRNHEAETSKPIKELGFSKIVCQELSQTTAQEYLRVLGIQNFDNELINLSQNLLNLSLIAELVSQGENISDINGLAQLWEMYIISVKKHDGEEAFIAAMTLADKCQVDGVSEFTINWQQITTSSKLVSHKVVRQTSNPFTFKFRHNQLQTFFCAYFLFRSLITPQEVVSRYGKYNSKAILIWFCILYEKRNTQSESAFVDKVLNDDDLIPYYTKTSILDRYIHHENLAHNLEIVATIVNILNSKEELRTYFFRNNPSPAWAKILWENDFLSTPPEPITTKDGYSLKLWDVQYFLIIVAPQAPEIVVSYVNALNGHAWYLAKAIEALSKIPVEFSEKAVPTVIKWISDPQVAEIAQTETIELIDVMIKSGKVAVALSLFDLLAAKRDERKSYNTRDAYRDVFGYRHNKSDVFEILKNTCALDLIQILERHLVKSLYSEETGEQKYSWWRNAIEETEQDRLNHYQDHVLSALRDTFVALIENHSEQSIEIIAKYLESKYTILRRLALYLISSYPTIFHTEAVNELLNPNNMDDSKIHHEFFLLLENSFFPAK